MSNDTLTNDTNDTKRTVSTARLERIRCHLNMTVIEFFQALTKYAVENKSESFQDSLTKFSNSHSNVKSVTKKNTDFDTIKYLVEKDIFPIKGELNKIQNSRKYKQDHVYLVLIQQSTGTVAKTTVDMVDLNNITVEVSGVLIATIDSRDFSDIVLRSTDDNNSSIDDDSIDTNTVDMSGDTGDSDDINTAEDDFENDLYDTDSFSDIVMQSEEVL